MKLFKFVHFTSRIRTVNIKDSAQISLAIWKKIGSISYIYVIDFGTDSYLFLKIDTIFTH